MSFLLRVVGPCCSSSRRIIGQVGAGTEVIPSFSRVLGLGGVREMSDKKGSSGGAGSIRDAGGKFAERESALEGQYFNKIQQEQIKKLKEHLHEEISHHEAEIKRHQEAIRRHKEKTQDLEKGQK